MTIFFYKVCQPYGCFSNFSPHPIDINSTRWSTVEHYYQAQKFLGSEDAHLISLIYHAPTPEAAAILGRCPNYRLRSDWELIKIPVMRTAVRLKFLTHTEIREVLLLTGDKILVENSPTDYFWGCGIDQTGENHLGRIIMSVRTELRQQFG
jgi:ribA/ribD-fused uncharacterized protein